MVALGAVLIFAFVGPFVAPYGAGEIVGLPYAAPSPDHPLGTDYLGEDVWSRLLLGGWTVIVLAGIGTLIAYVVGTTLGLVAAFDQGWPDSLIMRSVDVLLAIPPILFLLVLATGTGAGPVVVVLGIAIIQVPTVARVVRSAALEVSVRGYVEAATARGDKTRQILFREVLPNISGPIAADLGPRFTVSILLVAGLNFLGIGLTPPDANWAVMVSENTSGLRIQPLGVLAPALMIALLTVSANLVADGVVRQLGRAGAVGRGAE
jgi:ABC-type dipeptide/oligopeptide/nickel transport system permease subunit